MGRLIGLLERVLRRFVRNERLAGALLLFITVCATFSIAHFLLKCAYGAHAYAGHALAIYIAWICLAARSLHLESRLVTDALERGDIEEARRRLSRIVGRDTAHLDEGEIWRATVETVAENASDGVIAPLFYLMLGGPALALAYKAVNTLDSMVGYRNERYIRFGWASARFDDLLNYIPARLTGLLMVLAAPLLGLSAINAFRMMHRDGRNHSSPNSGVPEAAAAGALGVQLGGTNIYFGRPVEKPTIGEPLKPLSAKAYRGVVRLMYVSMLLMVVVWFWALIAAKSL